MFSYFHPNSMIPHMENGGEAAGRAKRGYEVPSEARLIKYISTYTCKTIKSTAAKPPIERSEANKVTSEISGGN